MNKDILLASKVKEKGGRAFYVGGYVRDLLLNIPNKDIDIEVHGIAEKDLVAILNEIGEVDYYGRSFGIYALRHEDIEVALPRSEKVLGTGHRDFEISVNPDMGYKKAALRRDFTINALMMDVLSHEILDYFNGTDDLNKGIIRHVNDVSFVEDPLRVYRAAQFASRFGFKIDERTVELCKGIDTFVLSRERIEEELKKALLKAERAEIFFECLKEMNQKDVWFKGVNNLSCLMKYESNRINADNKYYFMVLLLALDNGLDFIEAFSNNRELKAYVKRYYELYELINNRTLFTERYLKDSFDDFVYILSVDEKVKVNSYLENIDRIKLNLVSGDELLRRNIKPGENFGRALRDINRLIIEGMDKKKAIGVILKEFSEK
ncbi:MAG: CCA tRNA nucleotidyltransferase [Erysipelotrichaceae bacterium]